MYIKLITGVNGNKKIHTVIKYMILCILIRLHPDNLSTIQPDMYVKQ